MKINHKPGVYGTLTRLLRLSRSYWPWYLGIVLLSVVLSLTTPAYAELMRRIVNAIMEQQLSAMTIACLLLGALALVEAGGSFLSGYVHTMLQNRSTLHYQARLLNKTVRLRQKELHSYHSGDLLSRIHDAAPEAQEAINSKTMDLFRNSLQLVFLLAYLSVVHVGLALGSLIITLVIPLFANPLARKMRDTYTKRQEARAQQDAFLMDSLQGMEVIKSYSIQDKMTALLRDKWDRYLVHHLKALALEAVFYRVNILVYVLGLMYILGYGGYLIVQGRLDVGALAAFLVVFERLSGPISNLSSLWPQLQGAIASAARTFEVMDLPSEEEAASIGAKSGAGVGGDIRFDNVLFRYAEGAEAALQGVSFTIARGQVTAIVGESGSGKSTIASLLLGVHRPDEGRVSVGEHNLADMELRGWRESLAYVSQEPYLFSGTIGENIRLGKPAASLEEVKHAAQAANLHDWVETLPAGYDTVIGERGATLSGGERQRISIARALIKHPSLLVLDEPTSALDGENERMIQESIQQAAAGKTVVIIAHRLSTIKGADHILCLHQGRIVSEGTHEELMERSSYYRMLYERGIREGKGRAV
ncbi:ABC transporter ATP-binding protein [Paenibacillus sp. SYP-B4298]|uniref:ABC transporter ATP-binding protein n=1 Tax=Paenibacillus sp. SYP-B4298 TaxID=2996034 RepID=UPI0022DD3E19|nr:ABC transporter ATP-binding protein [Paenibacillus sp. SYP-B4298]